MKPKILCVVGARPQFVKHAPVLRAFAEYFETITAHTCQHYDHNMSQVFFDELEIPAPEFVLQDTNKRRGHGQQTASMLSALESLLLGQTPAAVLVYGDTNSTLAGALAASKLHIPILHVEAGLRSYNREMPEEINRVITDHISSLLFAPTSNAVKCLEAEGIIDGVHLVGDVMFDAVKQFCIDLKPIRTGKYAFATLHRPYNVDDPERLSRILTILNSAGFPVVLPLHPRTQQVLRNSQFQIESLNNIEIVEPVGYKECLAYQKFAQAVLTDSGGIQKEAYALEKRCLTIRSETEWIETLERGCNLLVGDRLDQIPSLLQAEPPSSFGTPYGDGNAAQKMAKIASDFLRSKL